MFQLNFLLYNMFFNYVSHVRLTFSAHYQSSVTSHFTQTGTLWFGQSSVPAAEDTFVWACSSSMLLINFDFEQHLLHSLSGCCQFCVAYGSLHSSIKHEVKGMRKGSHGVRLC